MSLVVRHRTPLTEYLNLRKYDHDDFWDHFKTWMQVGGPMAHEDPKVIDEAPLVTHSKFIPHLRQVPAHPSSDIVKRHIKEHIYRLAEIFKSDSKKARWERIRKYIEELFYEQLDINDFILLSATVMGRKSIRYQGGFRTTGPITDYVEKQLIVVPYIKGIRDEHPVGLIECAHCGEFFMSNRRTRYCSDHCKTSKLKEDS